MYIKMFHRFFRISLKIMFDQSRDIVGDAKPLRSLVVSFFLNQVIHHEFHSNHLTRWQKEYVVDAIFWADLCGKRSVLEGVSQKGLY